jgi:hypothetical protein
MQSVFRPYLCTASPHYVFGPAFEVGPLLREEVLHQGRCGLGNATLSLSRSGPRGPSWPADFLTPLLVPCPAFI